MNVGQLNSLRKRVGTGFLVAWLVVPSSGLAQNGGYDPAADLYLAFQGSCSSVGRFTTQALQQNSALRDVLLKLRDDANCQGLSSLLSQFVNLEEKLGTTLAANNPDWIRHQSDRQINDLLAAIGAEDNANVKLTLLSELARVRINSIQLENGARTARRSLIYQDASKLVTYSRQLLAVLNTDQSCLQNRKGLAAQIAGQVMAVGSSLVASPVGPALMAGGALVDALARFIQGRPYSSAIKDIQIQRLAPAVGCAFEAIAQNYCRARDTEKLVQALANPKKFRRDELQEWTGLDLLFDAIDAFNEATNRLVAGAPPSNPSIAQRKNRAEALEATFRAIQNKLDGTLLEAKSREERLPPEDRINSRRKTISDLQEDLQTQVGDRRHIDWSGDGIPDTSPFAPFFSFDRRCGPQTYLMTGKRERIRNGTSGSNECPAFEDALVPDFATIESNLKGALEAARRFVATESSLIRENDLPSVLAIFELSQGGRESARDFLEEALPYLQSLPSRPNPPPRFIQSLIEDTIARLGTAQSLLNTPQNSMDAYRATVAELAEQLSPAQDSLYIFKRFQQIVRWDLNQMIQSGQMKEDFEFIFQSTLDDSFAVMSGIDLNQLQPALRDARMAQTVSLKNLESLSKSFIELIDRFFKGLGKTPGVSSGFDAVNTTKTNLCLQVLSDPNLSLSNHRLRKECAGKQERSVYQDQNLTLDFDAAMKLPLEQRICELFDFDRKVRVYGAQRERLRRFLGAKTVSAQTHK